METPASQPDTHIHITYENTYYKNIKWNKNVEHQWKMRNDV